MANVCERMVYVRPNYRSSSVLYLIFLGVQHSLHIQIVAAAENLQIYLNFEGRKVEQSFDWLFLKLAEYHGFFQATLEFINKDHNSVPHWVLSTLSSRLDLRF